MNLGELWRPSPTLHYWSDCLCMTFSGSWMIIFYLGLCLGLFKKWDLHLQQFECGVPHDKPAGILGKICGTQFLHFFRRNMAIQVDRETMTSHSYHHMFCQKIGLHSWLSFCSLFAREVQTKMSDTWWLFHFCLLVVSSWFFHSLVLNILVPNRFAEVSIPVIASTSHACTFSHDHVVKLSILSLCPWDGKIYIVWCRQPTISEPLLVTTFEDLKVLVWLFIVFDFVFQYLAENSEPFGFVCWVNSPNGPCKWGEWWWIINCLGFSSTLYIDYMFRHIIMVSPLNHIKSSFVITSEWSPCFFSYAGHADVCWFADYHLWLCWVDPRQGGPVDLRPGGESGGFGITYFT